MQKSLSIKCFASLPGFVLAASLPAIGISAEASAQSLQSAVPSPSISTRLPAQLPVETIETVTGPDGVETVTRTRRIPARVETQPVAAQTTQAAPIAAYRQPAYPQPGYPQPAYAPGTPYGQPYQPVAYAPAPTPVVFNREQWVDECRRRTAGSSSDERQQLIGGLLGTAIGGIAGNRIASGERLGGTLIGAGAGGLAGAAIGNALGEKKDDAAYDCQAALDNYLSQYSANGGRVAARTIPAGSAYPAQAYPQQGYYGYPNQAQPYAYQQPNQVVWVPVQVEQPQRVIVRETVREEGVPAARRVPQPSGSKLIQE